MKDLTEQIYDELNAQIIRLIEHSKKVSEENEILNATLASVTSQGFRKDDRITKLERKLQEQDAMLGRRPCQDERCVKMAELKAENAKLHAGAQVVAEPVTPYTFSQNDDNGCFEARDILGTHVADIFYRRDMEAFQRALNAPVASQPASADKLREAIADISNNAITEVWESCGGVGGFYKSFGYQQFAHAVLDLAADAIASTAVQAPVREVPETARQPAPVVNPEVLKEQASVALIQRKKIQDLQKTVIELRAALAATAAPVLSDEQIRKIWNDQTLHNGGIDITPVHYDFARAILAATRSQP